jgi:hypothetical protein
VALAFQPDGKVLASGDYSGLVRLWDTSTGKEIGRPLPQREIVLSLAYSPDGKMLAVGLSNDHTGQAGIRLWDTETREIIGEFLPSTEPVKRIEFRSDGRGLLAVHDHDTQFWDASRGRAIGGPMVDEMSGGFRTDGRAFLTLGRDGAVKLRDAMTGAVLARLLTTHSPAVCAAFRGDGCLVAAGFQDGSIRLCDPATSQSIGPPRFMEHAINKVTFTPDGNSVAGIDIAGNTRTWPVPRPLSGASLDDLKLRIEARTVLQMEAGRTIARLDIASWRERLQQLGRLDPAAVQPDDDPAWHEPMVSEAEQDGHSFAALWHLDRLIAARPDDWSLRARRAHAWSLSDRSDRFDKAVPAPPPLYRHIFSNALGGLLLRAGRVDEAIVRLNEGITAAAVEIPTDWAYLALAHARKGNLAEARRSLKRLRASRPDPSTSFWELQELELLQGEAEFLLVDAEFPSDPFQSRSPR